MALISNSSIQAWLNLDQNAIYAGQRCLQVNYTEVDVEPIITEASCAQVCNDSVSLFYTPSNNLLNCGIWTTLVSQYTFLGPGNTILESESPSKTGHISTFDATSDLKSYETFGLDFNNTDTPTYADTISNCLTDIYHVVKQNTFAADGSAPAACTRNKLFPFQSTYTLPLLPTDPGDLTSSGASGSPSLRTCIDAICAPRTLNPNLPGIGFFSSFLIQSGIVFIASAALLAHELWTQHAKAPLSTFNSALVAALVDFHKIQCYFLSTIHIRALVLYYQNERAAGIGRSGDLAGYGICRNVLDPSALVILATSGYLPITLSLTCIVRHGRQSWHLLALSIFTFVLATATLVSSSYYFHRFSLSTVGTSKVRFATCRIEQSFEEFLYPICGTSRLDNNSLGDNDLYNHWAWAVWAYCFLWLVFCAFGKVRTKHRLGKGSERLFLKFVWPRMPRFVWTLSLAIIWILSFSFQPYLFSLYFTHSLIPYTWSFGQIIAVTAWVPSIVEYVYILYNGIEEASKYRYPSPLKVMKGIAYQSLNLATLDSPPQAQAGASASAS